MPQSDQTECDRNYRCLLAASLLGQQGGHGLGADLNGGSFALTPADIGALRQGHPLYRCLSVLNHVMQQPAAAPFCSQVSAHTVSAANCCLHEVLEFFSLPVPCPSANESQFMPFQRCIFKCSATHLEVQKLCKCESSLEARGSCLQDAGFMAYFHMTGEKPIDLSIVRSRLLPGTTQVRSLRAL